MTRDELIERVAQEIATAMGDGPDKIAPLPSSDYYNAATRIVDLLSPVLKWRTVNDWQISAHGGDYLICDVRKEGGAFEGYCGLDETVAYPTLEAAKAAARAHATAEWIATTKAAKEQAND